MRLRSLPLALLAGLLVLVGYACDKASPVAPEGTVLTITVNPSTIPTNGSASVVVNARKPNGMPLSPGTVIRFATSLGTIAESVPIDDQGIARATLRGDGRAGTAKVTASAGASETVEAEVKIGSPGSAISILVSPSNLPEIGGVVQMTALVRDENGQPQPSAQVNFQSEIGRLASGGGIVLTDAQGQARETLTVTSEDLATLADDRFEVTAQVGGATGGLVEATAEVTVGTQAGSLTFQVSPTNLPQAGGTVSLLALVRNAQGIPLSNARVTFLTELGTLGSGGGAVFTNAAGEARDTLTVTAEQVAALGEDSFEVTAQAAGGSGNLIEKSVTIAVGARAASVSLQATPSSVPETGGAIALLALVRNSQGAPLANAAVNFTTDVGSLDSRGSIKFTDANGEVRDTLQVTADNLSSINEDRFDVGAQVGGASGNLLIDTFEIRIQRAAPIASFRALPAGGNSVFFENTTTGTEPITYAWDFQSDGTIDSNVKNPTFNYGSPGSYTVRLEATNSSGSDVEIRTITVPVS